jgi:tol-pal system protein YbgF
MIVGRPVSMEEAVRMDGAVIKRTPLGLAAACCVLALAGCASTPPEEDPVQIKLNDLDTRLSRIEKVMTNQSLLEVANQIQALRDDVRGMHNDVDQMNNALESGRKQQRDMYADLDQRLKALESRGGGAASAVIPPPGAGGEAGTPGPGAEAGAGGAGGAASGGAGAGDDRANYQSSFNLLKDGQYDRAIQAFQGFLATYPNSALADNAQYWLGEAYYVNRAFPEAQSAFQRVVDKYPDSRKVADALLKIGYCRYETKQLDAAKSVLKQVVTQYPDTPAARLAQQRLDKMAAEQH